MIIIIEGPDGAGKTTLMKRMAEQTGYPTRSFSYPRSKEEKDGMFDMYVNAIKSVDNLIMDRSWYSDMVYAPIMRQEHSPINIMKMNDLEDILAVRGALIIHCTDDVPVLWQRCNLRGEDYVSSVRQLHDIKFGYEDLFHVTPHIIPVTRYHIAKNL